MWLDIRKMDGKLTFTTTCLSKTFWSWWCLLSSIIIHNPNNRRFVFKTFEWVTLSGDVYSRFGVDQVSEVQRIFSVQTLAWKCFQRSHYYLGIIASMGHPLCYHFPASIAMWFLSVTAAAAAAVILTRRSESNLEKWLNPWRRLWSCELQRNSRLCWGRGGKPKKS